MSSEEESKKTIIENELKNIKKYDDVCNNKITQLSKKLIHMRVKGQNYSDEYRRTQMDLDIFTNYMNRLNMQRNELQKMYANIDSSSKNPSQTTNHSFSDKLYKTVKFISKV